MCRTGPCPHFKPPGRRLSSQENKAGLGVEGGGEGDGGNWVVAWQGHRGTQRGPSEAGKGLGGEGGGLWSLACWAELGVELWAGGSDGWGRP